MQDLGMVDGKAAEVEVSIHGRDFTIRQSPGVLQSTRESGTTGAALWRVSVQFAEWLGSKHNALFQQDVLTSESVVLELGAGISGLVPSVLSSRVRKVIATDQQYILKLLQENIDANRPVDRKQPSSQSKTNRLPKPSNIEVFALDWETDDVATTLRVHGLENGVDAIVVSDCVFNYALIEPLVETCRTICQSRTCNEREEESRSRSPTLCIVAQQLRQPEVFQQWLVAFSRAFRVWRLPNSILNAGLEEKTQFVLHVGILR